MQIKFPGYRTYQTAEDFKDSRVAKIYKAKSIREATAMGPLDKLIDYFRGGVKREAIINAWLRFQAKVARIHEDGKATEDELTARTFASLPAIIKPEHEHKFTVTLVTDNIMCSYIFKFGRKNWPEAGLYRGSMRRTKNKTTSAVDLVTDTYLIQRAYPALDEVRFQREMTHERARLDQSEDPDMKRRSMRALRLFSCVVRNVSQTGGSFTFSHDDKGIRLSLDGGEQPAEFFFGENESDRAALVSEALLLASSGATSTAEGARGGLWRFKALAKLATNAKTECVKEFDALVSVDSSGESMCAQFRIGGRLVYSDQDIPKTDHALLVSPPRPSE